jgi:hypothetical protein
VFQIVIVGITTLAGSTTTSEFENVFNQLSFTAFLSDFKFFVLEFMSIIFSIIIPQDLFCDQSTTNNVRAALSNIFGTLIADVILLIPNIIIDAVSSLITGLSGGDVAGVVNALSGVFAAVINETLSVLGEFFIQLGNFFNCLAASNEFSVVFVQIGQFFQSTGLHLAVTEIFTIIFDLVALIVGIFQVIITGNTTIIDAATTLLGQLVAAIMFAIFGFQTTCQFQDAICVFDNGFQFAVAQCQAGDTNAAEAEPPFSFSHCRPLGNPSSASCFFENLDVCGGLFTILAHTNCPSSPFGCCGQSAFPADGTIPITNRECTACPPCDPSTELCDSRDICAFVLTPGVPFVSRPSVSDLTTALGQAALPFCPKFESLNICDKVVYLFNNGTQISGRDIVRAQPFGLRLSVSHNGNRLLSNELCESILASYGLERVANLSAPFMTRNPMLLQRAIDNLPLPVDAATMDAVKCYSVLYPEKTATHLTSRDLAQISPGIASTQQQLTLSGGGLRTPTSIGWQQGLRETFEKTRAVGISIYNKNNMQFARTASVAHISNRQQRITARKSQTRLWATHLLQNKNSLAHFLRGIGISHSAEQRVAERKVTRALFDNFHSYLKTRIEERKKPSGPGALHHFIALVLHMSDAVEHGAYALHYHLNLRSASEHLFQIRKQTSPARLLEIDAHKPSVASALGDWLTERRDAFVRNSLRKLRGFIGSEDYVKSTAPPVRWTDLRLHRRPRDEYVTDAKTTFRNNFAITAVLPNGTELGAALGLSNCDPTVQTFCTGCLVLDNVVFAVDQIVNSTEDFYTNPTSGFSSALTQFEDTIHNTLIDPVGNDTFTTDHPRTPFLFRRFLPTNANSLIGVNTFFTWNYTEFHEIVFANDGSVPPVESNAVGSTARQDMAIAAAANRSDADLILLNATSPITVPIISFFEKITAQLQSIGPVGAFTRLLDRYVICDYTKGVYCKSEHGIGPFDATVTVLLILFIVGVITSQIPGVGMCVMTLYTMFSLMIFVPLLWWIAYDASPLCTLPSFIGGVPGIPVCAAEDVQRLFEELVPECPPIPSGLIDPAFFEQASHTLCGTTGTVPPLLLCSQAAGFIDGFDNIFFIISTEFGENVTMSIADNIEMVAPSIAVVARIYTQAHLEALNARAQIGAICNLYTIFNIFAALAVLAIAVLASVGFIGLVAFIVGILIIAIILGIYANYVIWLQMRRGMFTWLMRFDGNKQKTE